jgi:hypothetical protein
MNRPSRPVSRSEYKHRKPLTCGATCQCEGPRSVSNHLLMSANCPPISLLAARDDRAGGQVDPADDDRVRCDDGLPVTVAYLHMHLLVELDGQLGWVAARRRFRWTG